MAARNVRGGIFFLLVAWGSALFGQAPVITAPPLTKMAVMGQPVSFSVSVTSAQPLSFQWVRNGQVIPGATSATLSIPNAARADHGWYRVVVSNGSGAVRSTFALHVAPGKGAVAAWGAAGSINYATAAVVPRGLGPVAAVAAGSATYAMDATGRVVSWVDSSTSWVVFSSGIVALSANSHVLGLKSDGTVVATGSNFDGQTTLPAGLANVVAVAAGSSHSLALRADGTVTAWGSNSVGQINVPAGLTDVVAISAGAGHSLAIKADGTVVGWGNNDYAQVSIPAGLSNVVAVSAGRLHSLALKGDGTVVAWGSNGFGQSNVPAGLTGITQIATGDLHSMALKADGTVVAWGHNSHGQVSGANGAKGVSVIAAGIIQSLGLFPAVQPAILHHPTSMSAAPGGVASFHVVATGTRPLEYRWKKNGSALVMPQGGRISVANDRLVIENVQADDAGSYAVEIVNAAGSVVSSAAVLSVATPPAISARPLSQLLTVGQTLTATVAVSGSGPFSYQWHRNGAVIPAATNATLHVPTVSISDRGVYAVVVRDADANSSRSVFQVDVTPVAFTRVATRAWTSSSTSLLSVPDPLSGVVEISAGGKFSLAVRGDGTVAEWGEDYYNQASVPAGLNDAVAVAAGTDQAVVLKADGMLAYWGPNAGFLFPPGTRDIVAVAGTDYGWVALRSDGTLAASAHTFEYVETAALTDVVAIAGGYALLRSGTVAKWLPWVPDAPAGLAGVIAIAAGSQHGLALKADGTVTGWGTGEGAAVPSGLTGITRIAAGASHSLAITADGTLVTWGDNSNGQRNMPSGLGPVLAVSGGQRHTIALVPTTSPVIATQPASQNVTAGNPFTLTVAATGPAPLFYQWRKNGVDIAGATLAQLVIPDAIESDTGAYTVRVQNAGGSLVSNAATIVVQEPNIAPVVRRAPRSVSVMGSGNATFALVAGGAGPRSAQWYYGLPGDTSQPIAGATGLSVTVSSTTVSQRVWARITNALGTIDSPAAVALRWEKANSGLGEYDLVMASFANGRFFLGSDYYIGSGVDGVNWTKNQTGTKYDEQIAYGNGVYVKGGGYNNSNLHTSGDGVTWTARPEAEMSGVVRIVFNGQLFVALAGDRSIKTSPDGITWTQRLSAAHYLTALAFGGGKTVAAGGGSNVYVSADGINWTAHPVPSAIKGIIYADNRFVGMGDYHVLSSADAVTWATQSPLSLSALGGGGGVLVAGRYDGSMFVSTDPALWAEYPGMLPGYSGTAHVAYGNGRFIVTYWDGEFLRSFPLAGAITTQNSPAVPSVLAGNSATLSVTATGAGLLYQWYRGWSGDISQPIAGATASTYTTPALTQATPYWVRVSNAAESVASATFNVVIATPPTLVSNPRRMEILAGTTATLSVSASSTPAASYQWYAGGSGDTTQPIAGAFGATFAASPAGPTSYWAKGSTAAGSVNSEAAVVTPWSLLAGQVPATSMAYFGGRYFAAANAVLSSVDGTSWTTSLGSSSYSGFKTLAAGNGLLMAVGNVVAGTTDGVTWTQLAQETSANALAFGNGVFVAASGLPRWSTDGRTWTWASLENLYAQLNSVVFANGKFVIVGDTSGSIPGSWVILTSVDGKQWTRQQGPPGPIAWLRDVVHTGSEFLAVGTQRTILASPDGIAWTSRPANSSNTDFRSVAYGAGVRLIVTGGAEYLRSTDGVTWTSHTPPPYFSGDAIEFLNGRFIAAGSTGWVYSSTDGLTWTQLSSWPFVGSTNQPRGLAIGNGRILLLSGDTATNGAARFFASSDGLAWSATNSPGPVNTELVFAQGAFYCGGGNGLIYRTVDGVFWEGIPAGPSSTSIQSLTYNGREFLALTGNGGFALNSLDGRAWTSREGLPTIYGKHPLASSGSVHVTASNWGGGIYVSSDLENWARATVPPHTYNVEQIVYGNGAFVGFDTGAGGGVLYSPDGAAWSLVTLPPQIYPSSPKLAFTNGRFWILTSSGYAWSTDGRNWQADDFDDSELERRGISNRLPAAVMAEGEGMMLVAGAPWLMKAGTVTGALGITRQPAGAIVHAGESATLTVEANGSGISYQWFEGTRGDASKPVAGATLASFTTPVLTQNRDYWVRVTMPFGVHMSTVAHVEVVTPPVVATQPADVDAVPGGSATFNAVATGDAPLQYQWSFNGARIPGATTSSYTVQGIQFAHIGEYRVAAFNAKGSVQSRAAMLRGANPPTIQTQPQGATISAGQSSTLSVTAASSSPLTYQWRQNGVAIPGATNSTYAINAATGPAAGRYDVVVSDGFAFTTSQAVNVQIVPTAYAEVLRPDPTFAARLEQTGGYIGGFLRLTGGRIFVHGTFSRINGTLVSNMAQLNSDGSVDAAFARLTVDGPVYAAAVQGDGKLVIGGSFRHIAGQPRAGLARLNADGSLDDSFVPAGDFVGTFALAIQTDGRIVAGGGFARRLARMSSSGKTDEAYPGNLDGSVYALATRADGGVLVGGAFRSIAGYSRGRIAAITAQGGVDTIFAAGEGCDDDVNALRVLADGRVLVGGAFTKFAGAAANRIVRVTSSGAADSTWFSGSGFNAAVYTLDVQADNRVLVGGVFGTYRGTTRLALARLGADGALDFSFAPPSLSHAASAVTYLSDGTVLIAGGFSSVAGTPRWGLARLSASGNTVVSSFGPGILSPSTPNRVLPLASGNVIVAGAFTHVDGTIRPGVARLDASGRLDPAFGTGIGPNAPVADAIALPSGEVVIVGSFTSFDGTPLNAGCLAKLSATGALVDSFNAKTNWSQYAPISWTVPSVSGKFFVFSTSASGHLVRRNADGSHDSGFDPGHGSTAVSVALEQPDGKVLVGGAFTYFNGWVNRLVRLLPTGGVDLSFAADIDGTVTALALQPDGRILIGGDFTLTNGVSRARIARLNTDGSVDASFNAGFGPNATVRRIVVQPDGRVVLVGSFTAVNGAPATAYAARLRADGSVDGTFAVPDLGAEPNDIALLDDGSVLVAGGPIGASSSGGVGLVRLQSSAGPVITTQPMSVALTAGATHTLSVAVAGGSIIAYQWLKNATPLSGATRAMLTLSSVQVDDAASYSVRITHASGSVDSTAATLTVAPSAPVVASDLISGFGNAIRSGSRWPLTAPTLAGGSETIGYQWSKDGVPITGATRATYLPEAWLPAHGGRYSVTISNGLGSVTSSPFSQLVTPSIDWEWKSPLPQGNSLFEARFLNNRFLLGGARGTILTSADGQTWNVIRLGISNSVLAFAYGNGAYVALTSFGGIWSSDGGDWTQRPTPAGADGRYFNALTFGAGRFVAVGGGGLVGTSTDGISWRTAQTGMADSLATVAHGAGRFVALGSGGRTYTSTDGLTWTGSTTLPRATGLLTYGGGKFVAAGSSSIFVSTDGIQWSERNPATTHSIRSLQHTSAGFLAALSATTGRYLASVDGEIWSEKTIGTPYKAAPNAITQGVGHYIAVGTGTETMVGSSDGTVWRHLVVNQPSDFVAAAVNESTLVAIGNSSLATITTAGMVSTPSTAFNLPPNLNDVAFGAGTFVVVGKRGLISASTDAMTWETRASGITSDLLGVSFVSNRFVALGAGGVVLTSTDGDTWAAQTSGVSQALKKAAFGVGTYVAVGTSGTVLTSTDGQTWIARSANGITTAINDVIYAAGKFVLITEGGSIRTSTDGATWVGRTNPLGIGLKSIVFGNGKFYAFTTGNTNYLTSADGVTWDVAQHGNANATGDAVIFGNRIYVVGANTSIVSQPIDVPLPTLTSAPVAQTVPVGGSATLSVVVGGGAPFRYQWLKNNAALVGSTGSSLTLAQITPSDAGSYSVMITNAAGTVTTPAVTLTVNAAQPALVASQAQAMAGTESLQGAFMIEGDTPKRMLIRAVGPTLGALGVTGFLVDPTLAITSAATGAEFAANGDWHIATNAAEIASVAAQVGAYPLSSDSKDAAVLATFPPGTYRVTVGPPGAAGVASLEIFDADATPRLVYLATRAQVGSAAPFAQAITLLAPPAGRSYLVRALGPSTGLLDALPNPRLAIFSGETELASNDDWGGDAALVALGARAGAMPIGLGSRDAALRFTPSTAGVYSMRVSSEPGSSGIALLEIFEVDTQRAASVPLAIVSPPNNVTVAAGERASFGVVAVGTSSPTFEWSKDGATIAGAIGPAHVIPSAQLADAGIYRVRVSNGDGSSYAVAGNLTVTAANNATHATTARGFVAGGTLTIANTIHYVGTPPTLGWSVELPAGWSLMSEAGGALSASARPAAGAQGTLTWTWTTPPASPVNFTYTLNIPTDETSARTLAATASVAGAPLVVAPSPLAMAPRSVAHTGDIDRDMRLNLAELTRVIELYNTRHQTSRTGCYVVALDSTGDGFTPDPSRSEATAIALAEYHSTDSSRDGRIDVFELTRVIQLYNYREGTVRTGRYRVQAGTEDGFAPGP